MTALKAPTAVGRLLLTPAFQPLSQRRLSGGAGIGICMTDCGLQTKDVD